MTKGGPATGRPFHLRRWQNETARNRWGPGPLDSCLGNVCPKVDQAICASGSRRRRRIDAPMPAKPSSIIAQVAGSGTALVPLA